MTGPQTKRSHVSRKSQAPDALKMKAALGAANLSARARVGAPPRTKAKARPIAEAPARRTSEILRQILEDNPQDMISVAQILKGLGTTSFGTSIMVFSTPELIPIPVPGISALAALPEMVLGAQMMMGNREVRLPKALLKRSIPGKALAKAVKTILPLLERAERNVRPRWLWATSPWAKRTLGAFIVALAGVISLPIPMTNMLPAIAMFTTGLGLVERDGRFIVAGVALGLASIALIGGAFLGLVSLFGRAA
jgi:hypothetical protein